MKALMVALLLFSMQAYCQKVKIIVTSLPEKSPVSDTVFMAGNINQWNPHDDSFKFITSENRTSSVTFTSKGLTEFKFTRGSWNKVERDLKCDDIGNRILSSINDTIIYVTIDGWADLCGEDPSTALDNVKILNDSFYIPQLNRYRKIWIYLPSGYETSKKRYPVLYAHDGQNLFDRKSSFSGEWEIDETLNRLYDNGNPGCIVVGIDNGKNLRMDEYSPWKNSTYGGGEGDQYVRFLVETLKPFIDRNYRTLPNRKNTTIIGSSMGGLISLYGGLKYQEVFGTIGCFSPAFWFSDSNYVYARNTHKRFESKIYFLAGGKESTEIDVVKGCEIMIDSLIKAGFNKKDMKLVTKEDGQHNEQFWSEEFESFIRWMN